MLENAVSELKVMPDHVFGSKLAAKFINIVMLNGKKLLAEKIVYGALYRLFQMSGVRGEQHKQKDPYAKRYAVSVEHLAMHLSDQDKAAILKLFCKVIANVSPAVEVRSRRVGGANYQVPVEVPPTRRVMLAMRWLVLAARARSEKGMLICLSNEMLQALKNEGAAYKKCLEMHRMAKANQAYASWVR